MFRAYELVPEAYRQGFRRLSKRYDQTFTELVWEKEALFDRWCLSSDVMDFNELKLLVLMEDFKNCLPEVMSTFLNEHKTADVFKAAVLVEEYYLTHKPVFLDRPFNKVGGGGASRVVSEGGKTSIGGFESERKPALSDTSEKKDMGELFGKEGVKCFYCKKKGHLVVSRA